MAAISLERRSEYLRRWSALDLEFDPWRRQYLDISDYMMPRTGRFLLDQKDRNSPPKYNNIIDNAATTANGILGAGMMAGMTSPARPWIRLATPDPDLMKFMPVKLWLADATNRMLNVFRKGNTYRALHSMYEELGAYGTGASMIQDDFADVVRQYPMTAGEYRIATDFRGEVTTLLRQFDMSVAGMVKEFGKEKCSQAVKNAFDQGNLDTMIPLMQIVEPRADRDPSMRDNKNMPWKSVYFERSADNPDAFLRESGYEEFPALVPRWVVRPGDTYGTSPGMMALGDTQALQHEQLRKGQAIDYMTKPPLQVPSAMKGHESDLLPGGVSYVDMANPNMGIRTAFQVQLDISALREDIQDVRQRIRSAFFADLFMMLSGSDHSRMTATEVAERHEEKLLMLGPVLERLHNEMLTPLVDITFRRMLEAGMLPPPPPELEGQNLDIEFVSILAQAQRAVSTNSTDRFVANLGQVAQFKPEVLDKFDADAWADNYADSLGVDPKLIVSGEQVTLIRQQRAQQQQAAQAAAQAQAAADTMQKLGNAPTGGGSNALTDVMQNLQGYSTPVGA